MWLQQQQRRRALRCWQCRRPTTATLPSTTAPRLTWCCVLIQARVLQLAAHGEVEVLQEHALLFNVAACSGAAAASRGRQRCDGLQWVCVLTRLRQRTCRTRRLGLAQESVADR